MEAYVWAATDSHLGVCISTRVFGSMDDAKADAQEAMDECPIDWHQHDDSWTGDFVDSNGIEGHVTVSPVKVRL